MITIAMVSNTCVVLPKIRLVLSGEPVVVSNLLRDMATHTAYTRNHTENTSNSSGSQSSKALNPNEAIPGGLEKQFDQMKAIIDIISKQSMQGRPIKKEQWMAFVEANEAMAISINHCHFLDDECGIESDSDDI